MPTTRILKPFLCVLRHMIQPAQRNTIFFKKSRKHTHTHKHLLNRAKPSNLIIIIMLWFIFLVYSLHQQNEKMNQMLFRGHIEYSFLWYSSPDPFMGIFVYSSLVSIIHSPYSFSKIPLCLAWEGLVCFNTCMNMRFWKCTFNKWRSLIQVSLLPSAPSCPWLPTPCGRAKSHHAPLMTRTRLSHSSLLSS